MTADDALKRIADGGAVQWQGKLVPIVYAEILGAGLLFFIGWPAEDQKDCHSIEFDAVRVTGGDRYVEFWQHGELVGVAAAAADWPELPSDDFLAALSAWQAERDGKAWTAFLAGQRECFVNAAGA